MRIAYHPSGLTMTDYSLRQWLALALLNIAAAPGIVIDVPAPRLPHRFGKVIMADDRTTLGGTPYSRIYATPRRGQIEFNAVRSAAAQAWEAWHAATAGGRIPWIWEEPVTRELIAVTCVAETGPSRIQPRHWQPVSLTLMEWTQ